MTTTTSMATAIDQDDWPIAITLLQMEHGMNCGGKNPAIVFFLFAGMLNNSSISAGCLFDADCIDAMLIPPFVDNVRFTLL